MGCCTGTGQVMVAGTGFAHHLLTGEHRGADHFDLAGEIVGRGIGGGGAPGGRSSASRGPTCGGTGDAGGQAFHGHEHVFLEAVHALNEYGQVVEPPQPHHQGIRPIVFGRHDDESEIGLFGGRCGMRVHVGRIGMEVGEMAADEQIILAVFRRG